MLSVEKSFLNCCGCIHTLQLWKSILPTFILKKYMDVNIKNTRLFLRDCRLGISACTVFDIKERNTVLKKYIYNNVSKNHNVQHAY